MQEKDIKDAINAYSKMSTEQLMAELVKHMALQKQKDGGVNMAQTIERIKPLLTPEQRKKLEQILSDVGRA